MHVQTQPIRNRRRMSHFDVLSMLGETVCLAMPRHPAQPAPKPPLAADPEPVAIAPMPASAACEFDLDEEPERWDGLA